MTRAFWRNKEKFYETLYACDPQVRFNITNIEGKKISSEDREDLDRDVTLDELTRAIRNFKPNKCPGSDGLIAEYYQFFWNKIGPLYHEALLQSRENGEFFLSTRRGIISLIPKKIRILTTLKIGGP